MHENDALVTIATFDPQFEASLARGTLEAIGISALVPAEAGSTFTGLYGGIGLGRMELKVFEQDCDRALEELRRMRIKAVEPIRRA